MSQGKLQSLKRYGHKSIGAHPSNQLSNQNRVEFPLLEFLEMQDLKGSKIEEIPAQEKDLFLGGEWYIGPVGPLLN